MSSSLILKILLILSKSLRFLLAIILLFSPRLDRIRLENLLDRLPIDRLRRIEIQDHDIVFLPAFLVANNAVRQEIRLSFRHDQMQNARHKYIIKIEARLKIGRTDRPAPGHQSP